MGAWIEIVSEEVCSDQSLVAPLAVARIEMMYGQSGTGRYVSLPLWGVD